MTKVQYWRLLLIILSLMILIGSAMVYLVIRFGHDGNAIKMDIQYGQPQKVEFSQFAMIPGGKSEYIITPYRYVPGVYNLTFDFQDKEIGHSIFDKSVYVYIECDGVVYCDQRLSSIFDSENPVITLDLRKDISKEIKLVYYIPEEIGNEIQGATADFELFIIANEKRDYSLEGRGW